MICSIYSLVFLLFQTLTSPSLMDASKNGYSMPRISSQEFKTYAGYQVLTVIAQTIIEAKNLELLVKITESEAFTPVIPSRRVDILVPPDHLRLFKERVQKFEVAIPDVGSIVLHQMMSARSADTSQMNWQQYVSHAAHNQYIDDLSKWFGFVNSSTIGKSFEGRDMKVLQILKAGPGKPNIWIDGGLHAREWISPAVTSYLINELLQGQGAQFLKSFNFHILPVANPDGYEFSRTKERLWRKNRSINPIAPECVGVDLNRNWDYNFNKYDADPRPCGNTYPGPRAFSEVETQKMRDYLLRLKSAPILLLSLHSYSQLWLLPFGDGRLPDNSFEMMDFAKRAVAAINATHGRIFTAKTSAKLYPNSGTTIDWCKGVLNARFVYTVELRGLPNDNNTFLLPEDQIVPSGEELWNGIKVILDGLTQLTNQSVNLH